MLWSSKTAKLFTKVMVSFVPSNASKIHKTHVEKHLIDSGYLNLAKKFRYFARDSNETRKCIDKAKRGETCPCCHDRFITGNLRGVCAPCYKSPRGKKLAKKIHRRTMQKVFCDKELSKYGYSTTQRVLLSKQIFAAMRREGWPLRIAIYNAVNRIESIPLCLHCKKAEAHLKEGKRPKGSLRSGSQYTRYCSCKCAASSKRVKRKHALALSRFSSEKWSDIMRRRSVSGTKLKEVVCSGKTFLCQGYEDKVLPRLVGRFGVDNVVSQFDPNFRAVTLSNRGHYTPDFFIQDRGIYLDVKSTWTFLDVNPSILEKNRQKQREMKGTLRFVVYKPHARKDILVMPLDWHTWTERRLRRYLRGDSQ